MYLFDIDGTLLLSGGAGSRVINAIFHERYGAAGVMDSVSPGGKTDEMILQECAVNASLGRELNAEEMETLLEEYIPRLRDELQVSEKFRLMPHVEECMEFLGKEVPMMGIATGNVAKAAAVKLARAGLAGHFRFGGYGCDSPVRSELVAKAVSRGRAIVGEPIAAEQFIVVGDTLRDIEAARACGLRVIAVATGNVTATELAAANPDAVFATLEELPDWHCSEYHLK